MDFKNILIKLLAAYGVISLLYYWEIFRILEFHVFGALTVVVTVIGAVLLVLTVLNRKK